MPGKGAFKRCVAHVEAKGSAYDPRAVCAEAGRKKYGKKRFQQMAASGKRRAARKHNAAANDYVAQSWDPMMRTWLSQMRFSTSREADRYARQSAKDTGWKWRVIKAPKTKNAGIPRELQKAVDTFTAYFPPTAALGLIPASRKSQKSGKRNPGAKRNPVDAAIEAFESFHGEAPKRIVEFQSKVHYHGTTVGLGELVKLKIRLPRDRDVEGGRVVTLKNFEKKGTGKPALLTMDEAATQLFIEGGDQELDLDVFGISEPHEVEHLGECLEVTYFTTKKHLGRDGGTANYVHKFGGEPGEAKTPRPQMIYRVRDKVIEFAGGGYSIPPEGIDG